MNKAVRTKLFLMMVLEFFIWGAWLPLIYGYLPSLGFSAAQQSWILNTFPIAAIVGMFFSNQYADRHFAAERFLAFSHLVGGLAMIGIAMIKAPAAVPGLAPGESNPNAPFWPFFGLMLIHCLVYVPTLSIVNSIAFAHIKNAQKEFGIVRMGGTIGWILAAWPFTFIFVDWDKVRSVNPQGWIDWLGTVLGSGLTGEALQKGTRWTYIVSAIASFALAAYSLVLPHTPPKKVASGEDRFAWLEATKLLRHPYMLVLWIVAFIDAFVLYSYFNWTGVFLGSSQVGILGNWIMPVMSIGQVAEILTMLILGATLKRLGWKTTMIIGILGHVVRFGVYAFYPQHRDWIILVQVLHGICYAFFFATVYIFVDEYFPKDARASAQGLFNVMILGIGSLAANSVCPYLLQRVFTQNSVTDFRGLFLVPLGFALFAALLLFACFHPPRKEEANLGAEPAPAS
ncbi:MAG: MFS transporter [Verrucomicrobia bacterium]|nr:MFS transporter [Verrucomicrobiota bacterium]